jgi:hypothetical protein
MYFDESAVSIVDSWLAKGTGSADKGTAVVAPAEAAVPVGRGGIGFKPTKKPAANKDDGFENRLKQLAAKKKRDEMEQSRQTVELHGVVEEEIEKVKRPKIAEQKHAVATLPPNSSNVQISDSTPSVVVSLDRGVTLSKPPAGEPAAPKDGSIKRQRKKTRSKQKNIRKDNRATGFKPEHLQIGSKSYTGRPLTKVNN